MFTDDSEQRTASILKVDPQESQFKEILTTVATLLAYF
jgi:hypothetical protein